MAMHRNVALPDRARNDSERCLDPALLAKATEWLIFLEQMRHEPCGDSTAQNAELLA